MRARLSSIKARLVVSPVARRPESSISVGCIWETSSDEPVPSERRGIDERRLAAHHLGDEPAADRAEGQAEMVVGEVQPKAGLSRERPDGGPHVRQAGAPPEPGRG